MTNHSHFIQTLANRYKVDFEALWQDAMRNKDSYGRKRAFDDRVETDFWADFSHRYDQTPSLYDYAPHVLERILFHCGKHRSMIEIGCGTGKFTLPMLAEARHVYALDFSAHMLGKLSEKLVAEEKRKITLVQAKWEAYQAHEVDCIYSVNALYRMREIRKALHKMDRAARCHVVIVWTMQRSVFDRFINTFHKTGLERNQEYIHLMALLYEMGIDAELEFIEASKPITMGKQEAHEQLKRLATTHDLPMNELVSLFHESVTIRADEYYFQCPLKVALIHWTPWAGCRLIRR